MGRAPAGREVSAASRYGRVDRLLHRLAFRLPMAQRTLAEVEEQLYRARLARTELGAPVFITSLPRAGTTILLRLLWRTGAFASTLYRDMPFVMAPLLWSRFAERFSGEDEPTERDHGDGLLISAASPEAFEEVLWMHFWPEHYLEDRIVPWTDDTPHPEFVRFFDSHMRKIVALRIEDGPGRTRYLSKNNLNIARLAAAPTPLTRGKWLIPVREPLQHAASMLSQHERFCILHDRDPFLRTYMESIGHHEFGRGLKPVDFGGWLEPSQQSADELAFWLRYWVATYRHLLDVEHALFLSYERLTSKPREALRELADIVAVEPETLVSQAGSLRPPRSHDVARTEVPSDLIEEAETLYRQLEQLSYI